jgi:hypothetical protein
LSPAVLLVLLGVGFTLGGIAVFLFDWKDRRVLLRRAAGQTPWSRRSTALARIGGTLFLAAGITAIAFGIAALADPQ